MIFKKLGIFLTLSYYHILLYKKTLDKLMVFKKRDILLILNYCFDFN